MASCIIILCLTSCNRVTNTLRYLCLNYPLPPPVFFFIYLISHRPSTGCLEDIAFSDKTAIVTMDIVKLLLCSNFGEQRSVFYLSITLHLPVTSQFMDLYHITIQFCWSRVRSMTAPPPPVPSATDISYHDYICLRVYYHDHWYGT